MSYYVTLPSNGADTKSDYGKQINKLNDFEIELKSSLDFSYQNYEVGLSEFSAKLSWLIPFATFKITSSKNQKHEFEFSCNDYISLNDPISYIGIIFKKIAFLNSENVLEYISIDMENYSNNVNIKIPINWELEISGYFANVLKEFSIFESGIKYDEINNKFFIKSTKGFYVPYVFRCSKIKLEYVQQLFIYTNIIETQHVGSEKVRLLRIVQVKGELGAQISQIFDFPHYLSLESNLIDNIRIFVCDSYGNKIKFSDERSNVIYKLHFRPKSI